MKTSLVAKLALLLGTSWVVYHWWYIILAALVTAAALVIAGVHAARVRRARWEYWNIGTVTGRGTYMPTAGGRPAYARA